MNIPFLSSTAINRDHYHLVYSVEGANSPGKIDAILVHKVEYLRKRFASKRSLSLSECSYALIILLYCWLNTNNGDVRRELLEFALPQAVNLAEAGSTMQQKRIGYTFCLLVMDASHELQLMLVNTLRKDIESPEIPRISLVLDFLSMKCPTDAWPAITPRLTDLLSHHSPTVKSKALVVIRNVARDDPRFWTTLSDQIVKGLNDPDRHVVVVTMRIMLDLLSVGTVKPVEVVNLLLQRFPSIDAVIFNNIQLPFTGLLSHLIPRLLSDEADSVANLLDMVFSIIDASHARHAVLLECFRIFSKVPSTMLSEYFRSQKYRPFLPIVESIDVNNPNAIYFCLACLEHVNAQFWTGNTDEFSAIFNEAQVNVIMGFLQSPDRSIRLKVLQTLKMVDKKILPEYLVQLTSNLPSNSHSHLITISLEVAGVCEEEGQNYASRLKEMCTAKKRILINKISPEFLEIVLSHLRTVSDNFKGHFVDEIMKTPPSQVNSTLVLIIATAVYEYGHLSSLPYAEHMVMMMDLLETKPALLQEPLLLAMLRLTAFEEAVPFHIIERISKLHDLSESVIKTRYAQFLTFSNDLSRLRKILHVNKCDSLPGFSRTLDSIEKYGETKGSLASLSYHDDNQSSTTSTPKGLRYEAYEVPHAPLKQIRPRDTSRGITLRSTLKSNPNTPETLTLSPGQLALAVYEIDLSKTEILDNEENSREKKIGDDLITLESDSPFLVDATMSIEGASSSHIDIEDFEHCWQSLSCPSTRGWSEKGVDQIVASFYLNFSSEYEVKDFRTNGDVGLMLLPLALTISPSKILASIRLYTGEEGTTLWQMRCPDVGLRNKLKLQFT